MTTQVGSSSCSSSARCGPIKIQELNWAGTFSEYLDIVGQNPKVTLNDFQRIDLIMQRKRAEEFIDAKNG
jgi:serine protein kinase